MGKSNKRPVLLFVGDQKLRDDFLGDSEYRLPTTTVCYARPNQVKIESDGVYFTTQNGEVEKANFVVVDNSSAIYDDIVTELVSEGKIDESCPKTKIYPFLEAEMLSEYNLKLPSDYVRYAKDSHTPTQEKIEDKDPFGGPYTLDEILTKIESEIEAWKSSNKTSAPATGEKAGPSQTLGKS